VWGISTDSTDIHSDWIKEVFEGYLSFPLLSFPPELCQMLHAYNEAEKVANRVVIILDPERKVRHYSVVPLNVGRDTYEILRLISAMQACENASCPVVAPEGWVLGDDLIELPKEQ
jgi:alkyl hydroperoxide reductase subunit AhpC